jgi:hypothetical protein
LKKTHLTVNRIFFDGGSLAVFLIDSWVPVKGKDEENERIVKEILQYGARHPEASKYVMSLRYFKQSIGGKPPGRRVLITEFKDLSDMEAFFKEIRNEPEWQKISREWRNVMDQTTVETMIWNDQHRKLWMEK